MLTSSERRRFDRVTQPKPAKQHYSTLKCEHFLAVLLCFAKIFRKICVENYKEFNGVTFSSTRARMNVLASFNLKAGMNSRLL